MKSTLFFSAVAFFITASLSLQAQVEVDKPIDLTGSDGEVTPYGAGSSSAAGRTYFNLSNLDHNFDNLSYSSSSVRCVR